MGGLGFAIAMTVGLLVGVVCSVAFMLVVPIAGAVSAVAFLVLIGLMWWLFARDGWL